MIRTHYNSVMQFKIENWQIKHTKNDEPNHSKTATRKFKLNSLCFSLFLIAFSWVKRISCERILCMNKQCQDYDKNLWFWLSLSQTTFPIEHKLLTACKCSVGILEILTKSEAIGLVSNYAFGSRFNPIRIHQIRNHIT